MDGPWVVYFQNCVQWPRPPSKMAAMSRHSFNIHCTCTDDVEPYGIWIVKLRCIRHADILKRAYLCQVSDTGSPEPLVNMVLDMKLYSYCTFYLFYVYEGWYRKNPPKNSIEPILANGTGSFRPVSHFTPISFCPDSLLPRIVSPSFINSALKN
jgi:hypothetical protein